MVAQTSDISDRYMIISTDGHCGANLFDYKPYLESRFHDDFDHWAADFYDPWGEVDTGVAAKDPDNRMGHSSFNAPLNWESQRRLRVLEEQGVVAEVLFPNTAPPFYPSGALTAPGPRTPQELEYRWAGLRAHNRWLVDFCADAPGRRAGVAQLFLDDVEDAVTEIRWAKEAGLMGVLLSAPHVLKMVNLYYPELDPVWAVCSELDMPVCIHASVVTESGSAAGLGAALAGTFEASFYPKRQIAHLIANAVFERFPDLKVAATELTDGSAIPGWLTSLDARVEEILRYSEYFPYGVKAAKRLRRKPSEYFATNVFLAGPLDLPAAIASGAPNLMFGADLPHAEGTWPYTSEALRLTVSSFSEQERRQFLSERQAQVYGFDLTRLTGVAMRVGPLEEDVQASLSPGDGPRFPYDTRCFAFRPKAPPAGRP